MSNRNFIMRDFYRSFRMMKPKNEHVLLNATPTAWSTIPTVESATGILNKIPTEVKEQVMSGQTVLNENIQTDLYSQDLSTPTNKTISIN